MKTRMQNVNNALTDENWTKYFPSYFTDDSKLKIGNYHIFYPLKELKLSLDFLQSLNSFY